MELDTGIINLSSDMMVYNLQNSIETVDKMIENLKDGNKVTFPEGVFGNDSSDGVKELKDMIEDYNREPTKQKREALHNSLDGIRERLQSYQTLQKETSETIKDTLEADVSKNPKTKRENIAGDIKEMNGSCSLESKLKAMSRSSGQHGAIIKGNAVKNVAPMLR